MDDDTAGQVRTLMSKGFAGTVFLTTDDVRSDYEELKGRGVEFTEEPEERPYGIDAGLRDPSGNSLRLTQLSGDLS
jgi:predicted enzyme related to lactoylglutathione lyase